MRAALLRTHHFRRRRHRGGVSSAFDEPLSSTWRRSARTRMQRRSMRASSSSSSKRHAQQQQQWRRSRAAAGERQWRSVAPRRARHCPASKRGATSINPRRNTAAAADAHRGGVGITITSASGGSTAAGAGNSRQCHQRAQRKASAPGARQGPREVHPLGAPLALCRRVVSVWAPAAVRDARIALNIATGAAPQRSSATRGREVWRCGPRRVHSSGRSSTHGCCDLPGWASGRFNAAAGR